MRCGSLVALLLLCLCCLHLLRRGGYNGHARRAGSKTFAATNNNQHTLKESETLQKAEDLLKKLGMKGTLFAGAPLVAPEDDDDVDDEELLALAEEEEGEA